MERRRQAVFVVEVQKGRVIVERRMKDPAIEVDMKNPLQELYNAIR